MTKTIFNDGSYIETNESGYIYIGIVANEIGHIIRKTGCTLEAFMEVFESETHQKLLEMLNEKRITQDE